MANTPSARKRAIQAETRRQRNQGYRSKVRTYVKKVKRAVAAGDREAAQRAYAEAVPVIDSVARKGIIHPNKAARHKSRLNDKLRQMAQ